jgi:hypothetical protein
MSAGSLMPTPTPYVAYLFSRASSVSHAVSPRRLALSAPPACTQGPHAYRAQPGTACARSISRTQGLLVSASTSRTYSVLRICACNPACGCAPRESGRPIQCLKHENTCCNIHLKQIKHLEHMLVTYATYR